MSETPPNPPSPDDAQGQQPPPQDPSQQGQPGQREHQEYGRPEQQAQPQYPAQPPQPQPQSQPQGQEYGRPQPGDGQPQQPGQAQPYGQPGAFGQAQPGQAQPQPQPQAPDGGNDILVAMLAHLSGFVIACFGWIPPLAVYFAKRNQSPFVRHHASEAANFQITMLIPYVLAGAAFFGLGIFFPDLSWIGYLLIALVWIISIIFGVLGASGANKGAWYRYPVSIRLLK